MSLDQETHKSSPAQFIAVLLVGFLSAGALGGYIYYGMQQVKVEVIPVSNNEVAAELAPTPSKISAAEKAKIIDALSQVTTSSMSDAEKTDILDQLQMSASISSELTPDKSLILEQLNKNNTVESDTVSTESGV